MLVRFQYEIFRLNLLQPFGLVLPRFGIGRNSWREMQAGGGVGRSFQLGFQHRQMIFIDMCISDEIGEPSWAVSAQMGHQGQQSCALSQIEGGSQSQIITADIQAKGEFPGFRVGQKLIEQVAWRESHLVQLRPVPAMEQDATAGRVGYERIETVA